MFHKSYSNFVKASSPERCTEYKQNSEILSGEEARRLYLEEVKSAKASLSGSTKSTCAFRNKRKIHENQDLSLPLSNKDLFITVQNNDVDTLKSILDKFPDKISVVDDYGWSLLMIACQASSIDAAKMLLKRGVDMSVRDRAGNSARSLVIKNKNYILADLLLNYKEKDIPAKSQQGINKVKSRGEFSCEVCNKTFPDREEHLSSTLHNISASRGMKIPAKYVLPQSNRGYQLMLKGGWDKQSGLGRDGSGKLYPIRTVQKKDRKGLGHKKRKCEEISVEDNAKHKNRKKSAKYHQSDKSFEIYFRREFY